MFIGNIKQVAPNTLAQVILFLAPSLVYTLLSFSFSIFLKDKMNSEIDYKCCVELYSKFIQKQINIKEKK
jgi:hypothetical protein